MASSSSSSPSSLKAQFYVIRHNGSFVPLVAMDELPTTITVRDVPRVIEARDTVGMISVGEYDSRHSHHSVEFKDASNPFLRSIDGVPNNTNTLTLARSLQASKHATVSNGLTTDLGYPSPPRSFGIQEQPPTSSASSTPSLSHTTPVDRKVITPISPADSRVASPVPLPIWHDQAKVPRANGIKTYCSYWLRHGECDYAQQGCLYKHEMPLDLPTLRECGMRDVPRWYRELHGVGSLLAVPGSDASRNGVSGPNWRIPRSVSSDKTTVVGKPIGMKPGIVTVREPTSTSIASRPIVDFRRNAKSGRNNLITRRNTPMPVGPTARAEQDMLMKTIAQISASNARDAKFKKDLAERASAKPIPSSRPSSGGDDSGLSTSPNAGDVSGSDSNGNKPGFNTPVTAYSTNASDADDEKPSTKIAIKKETPLGLGLTTESLKKSITLLQMETQARVQTVNNVAKSLDATQASTKATVSPSLTSRTKTRAQRGGTIQIKRQQRKESVSSVSTTGGIDGDADSLDGRSYHKRKESLKQPVGDLLLEGFEFVGAKTASHGAVDGKTEEVEKMPVMADEANGAGGMAVSKAGRKAYQPYDHDD